MTDPTRVIGSEGMGIYRNFTVQLEEVRKRARYACVNRYEKPFPWEGIEEDALYLALLVQALVEDKLELASRLNLLLPPHHEKYDLCPCCGGGTWGRPLLPNGWFDVDDDDGRDYSRRQCSVCHWVRAEPHENQEAP